MKLRSTIIAVIGLALSTVLSGCGTNPATGEQTFTAFMSPQDEIRVGREEHPKVMKQFGGAYDDAEVSKYLTEIGKKLAARSELPASHFTFTVLDDPMVNAFALPGGYVYITRGLMALVDNEAQLAGVIAHEIGHVTARHSAQRYSQQIAVGLGAGLLGAVGSAVTGSRAVSDLTNLGAGLYLQSYSREHEFEADMLGVRYMSAAGYAPHEMAGFLEKMRKNAKLDVSLTGKGRDPDEFNILATHPRTVERVMRASAAAKVTPIANPVVARDRYLEVVDGLLYGDDPEQGLIQGQTFVHPKLRFRFEVPSGFRLINSDRAVTAIGPNKNAVIIFDGAKVPGSTPMDAYLRDVWGRKINVSGVQRLTINGLPAATGAARVTKNNSPVDMRLVTIRFEGERVYRLAFITDPRVTTSLSEALRRTTYSFVKLSKSEADTYEPYRIDVIPTAGKSVPALADKMPEGPKPEERFRVLNGIDPSSETPPFEKVKIVRIGR